MLAKKRNIATMKKTPLIPRVSSIICVLNEEDNVLPLAGQIQGSHASGKL
jgi:hypothetical protein